MVEYSREDTNQMKGIALLLLLFHHLFYIRNGLFTEFQVGETELISFIAWLCRVCVGIFVFFSGYGLYKSQVGKSTGLKSFYLKGFSKLYLNYWLMWVLFVPVGIFCFDRTLTEVYGTHVFPDLIINILGIQHMFGFWGYNPTWWFMTCILILYFIFPLLKVLVDKFDWILLFLLLAFSLCTVIISFGFIQFYSPIEDYLFTFVFGIFWAKNKMFARIKENEICSPSLKMILLFLLLIVFIWLRTFLGGNSTILTDGPITVLLAQLLFQARSQSKVLVFLGRHSFNIFLFHTFICSFYFEKYIYWFKNPFLIWVVLILTCCFISLLIEKLKEWAGYYKLQKKILEYNGKRDLFF